ncbi:hypothetical protein [Amycolatopsis nalaikhensis]|uniref:Uncharacterized protein n=1 Tax=Amycolatopsis nalaikhensis TaxID=715472 RepID=A0ABY8XTW7_9PSEU|nr:hypothetical protein [Amycolatopsis sp. 2-2]WIV59072.1 hypothetical protein QP939_10770 [Amycolatopsis sp. 2-2]
MSRDQLELAADAFVFVVRVGPREGRKFYCLVDQVPTRRTPVLLEVRPRANEVGWVVVIYAQPDTVIVDYFRPNRSKNHFAQLRTFNRTYLILTQNTEGVPTGTRGKSEASQEQHGTNRERNNEYGADDRNGRH